MISPAKIKAGDLFTHKNKKTYLCLGAKTTCDKTNLLCKHYEDLDDHLPCREYLYAFLIDDHFCWVMLKHEDWLAQFKKVI